MDEAEYLIRKVARIESPLPYMSIFSPVRDEKALLSAKMRMSGRGSE